MRNRSVVIVTLLIFCATALVTAQSASSLYQQGLAREQIGNCEGAIPIYERVVKEFTTSKDREQVATAKLHLGDCWIKKTDADKNKALGYLNDVTTNYSELKVLVGEANRIKGMLQTTADSGKPLQITTSFTEDVSSFAISPDGRNLVLQATSEDGKKQLWLQPVDPGKKPMPIVGTEGAGANSLPFFSPDGKYLGFFADGKLKRVSISGGIPQDIVALSSFYGGTWNKDDIIVYADGLNAMLYRIRTDGTDQRPVTTAAGSAQVLPKFLSDGLRFLFTIVNVTSSTLALGAIDHSPRSMVQPIDAEAAAFAAPDRMVYVAGGALMAQRLDGLNVKAIGDPVRIAERVALNRNRNGAAAVSVSDAGPVAYRVDAFAKRQFRLVDRKGSLIQNVGTGDSLGASSARISRDSKTVTFHRWSGTTLVGGMWTMDTKDGVPRLLANRANSAVWSPNTEHMMLAEQFSDNPNMDLFEKNGAREDRKHVTQVGYLLRVDDWSSTNYVLYERSPSVILPTDLVALPLDGGEPVPVTQTTDYSERNGRFSPDSAWVAYQSNELGARDEVFIQRFPVSANSRKRISLNGGSLPHWSSNGLQLYFLSADNQVMVVQTPRSSDGRDIVLSPATKLFPLDPGSEFDVAADGSFLINSPVEPAPPIYVLTNWIGKLPTVSSNSVSSPLVVPTPVGRPTEYGAQTQIVVIDRQQQVLSTVTGTGIDPKLSISPDGSRVAYLRNGDIWVHDIGTNSAIRVAANVSTVGAPAWSPEGDRIAYRASRNGIQGLYVKASNGMGDEELIYPSVSFLFNWSRDGFLAITTGNNFAKLPVDGDRHQVSIVSSAGKSGLRLAPDSHLAGYISDASGRNEVYVLSFDPTVAAGLGTAAPRKVSTQGGIGLIRWNANGREMYYLVSDGKVMVVSDARASSFDEQSSKLLFQVPDNFPLVTQPSPAVYSDISADGQRFVFALPAPAEAVR